MHWGFVLHCNTSHRRGNEELMAFHIFENIMRIKTKYSEKLALSKCSFSFLIENKSSLIQYITTTFSPLYSS